MRINKSHLILVILFLFVVSFIIGGFSETSFAGGPNMGIVNENSTGSEYESDNENILLRLLGGGLRWFAGVLYGFLGEASIDSLVFNEGGRLSGLTLFKPNAAQDFLASFYNLFNFIAIAIFIPIAYWSGLTFAKAGDNPQGKSLLKDRLLKIVLTFVLLYTMPQLLTLVVKISNGFVGTFASIGGGGKNPVGDYITNSLSLDDVSIIDGITALMLVGINLWMIFYYIVRDLTICFLFMFFPIIAIWYPLNGDMVKNWGQNMLGNILSQPVQAVVLTMVISLSNVMAVAPVVGASPVASTRPDFLTGLYLIVAFGSIIPMTSIIKGFLGLEGRIGAASSKAGLGGMMAAVGLFKMAKGSFDTNKSLISEGLKERGGNKVASEELEKNISPSMAGSSSIGDLDRPLVNPSMNKASNMQSGGEITKESLKASNRLANKKIARGAGSIFAGGIGGLAAASIGGGVGAREAVTMGLVGYGLGTAVGGVALSNSSDLISGVNANLAMSSDIKDLQLEEVRELYSEGATKMSVDQAKEYLNDNPNVAEQTLQTAQEKYLNMYSKDLSGTSFQNQERSARLMSERIGNISTSAAGNFASKLSYAKNASNRVSKADIMSMDNVNLYQDKDISYLYNNNEQGEMQVLQTGAGIPGMMGIVNSPVSFNPDNKGMASDYSLQYSENAAIVATTYMSTAYPDMTPDDVDYKNLYGEKYKETTRENYRGYNDNLELSRSNVGIPSMNINTNEARLNDISEQSVIRRKALLEIEMNRKNAKVEAEKKATTYQTDPEKNKNPGTRVLDINGIM